MDGVSGVTQSLVQSQLASLQTRQAIDVAVAKKSLDSSRQVGDAIVALLEDAVEVAQASGQTGGGRVTVGSLVSGLGQNVDVSG